MRQEFGLSILREHKFKYEFQNFADPMLDCGNGVATTIRFFSIAHILSFKDKAPLII